MKKIAIIGASYLQLPLVLEAKKMGLEVHCFAWDDGLAICKEFADKFYPISVLDKEAILNIAKDLDLSGITTIATDIATPTIAYIAEELNLVANSYSSALACTNKRIMRDALKMDHVSIPQYIDSNHNPSDCDKFPLIVKPTDRSGSRGVSKVENMSELLLAINIAKEESLSAECIIEEYIDGDEVSIEAISWQGTHYILAITDKVTTGSPHFVEIAHHQPSQLAEPIQQKIKQETLKALTALDIKFGASHTEIKINSKGEVYVIEVGARMGGDFIGSHLVELSTGYDYLEAVIKVALGEFETPCYKNKNYAGIYFLSKETKYLLPYFEKKSDFIIKQEIFSDDFKTLSNSNDRNGYFIYQADQKINLQQTDQI